MRIINNRKYSKKSFEDYELRVKIELIDELNEVYFFDVYTTQCRVSNILNDLSQIITKSEYDIRVIHKATKGQDDLSSKFIDEIFNKPWCDDCEFLPSKFDDYCDDCFNGEKYKKQ